MTPMTITKIERAETKAIRDRLQDALNLISGDVAEGITIDVGNATYDGVSCTFKVAVRLADAAPPEVVDYERHAKMFDLPPLGTTFRSGGDTFTITGFNPRARKHPILCDGPGGKRYVFSIDDVERLVRLAALTPVA